MTEIKAMSEGEHIVEVEDEFLETSDLSPHTTILNHEPPVIGVNRDYNDSLGKVDDWKLEQHLNHIIEIKSREVKNMLGNKPKLKVLDLFSGIISADFL